MCFKTWLIPSFIFTLILCGCNGDMGTQHDPYEVPLTFQEIDSELSGFKFQNILDEETMKNPFNYINAYNGGGVGIGDINNDGLQDIFVTGNMVSSRLFLNKGNMEFEDITTRAGIKTSGWCTGVNLADVNADGWLDIYINRAYHDDPGTRANLLFINNQKGGFHEKGRDYGINDTNFSVASSFFDYDRDGDMDLVVANHPRFRLIPIKQHFEYWTNPPLHFSSRLFKNVGNNQFEDVTEEAGILSYGFSLGLTTSDLDCDGWPDIYISVDHDEPDIVFHNKGDGTFEQITETALKSNSRSSMGIDVGDMNADPYPDVIVAEMLPEDHYREKISMSMQTVDRFNIIIDSLKYKYYQMRNYLHLNNGNNTFIDVGQFAGIHRTDWSWSTLFMDANNDSRQDLFVSNGYYRDIYDKDYKDPFDEQMMLLPPGDMKAKNEFAKNYARNCPQTKIPNYFFKNLGHLKFKNVANESGINRPTISTGAAYGDLDNDGDLDLVINNLGEYSSIFENTTALKNNYIRIKFKASSRCQPFGAKVSIQIGDQIQYRELLSSRGFQSSSEDVVHFGVGTAKTIDKLEVVWPVGYTQVLENVPVNQVIEVNFDQADKNYRPPIKDFMVEEVEPSQIGIQYIHRETYYDDYDDQVLLPHKLSELGPFISKGDANGDGQEDIYIGGSGGYAGELYVQNEEGNYRKRQVQTFVNDRQYEDMHSSFFDADGDGDQDLFVASGSYEFASDSYLHEPRLYINDGIGNFSRSKSGFSNWAHASSCVSPIDFDNDGDMDIFVGGRLSPKRYPEPGTSALFINDGHGNFQERIEDLAPGLKQAGMVTDAVWGDLNNDGKNDLIVVGEWMPIDIWMHEDGALINRSATFGTDSIVGWFNRITSADFDADGNLDFIVGNLGLNYKYTASKDKPFIIYGKDFDNSGTCDIALGSYYGETLYPVRGRSCSSEQMPLISDKFETFEEYAKADFTDVYGEMLDGSYHFEVTEFASLILYGTNDGRFDIERLPSRCQFAPVNDVITEDIDNDGDMDFIVAGNLYQSEIETGQADAGTGVIVLNEGNRNWRTLEVHESGLYIANDVKSIELLKNNNGDRFLIVGNNQSRAQVVKIL